MEHLQDFIVFEGLDGAGTTTQARLLSEHLAAQGKQVYLTCEPTDGPIGRLIRAVLAKELVVTPRVLAKLYAADRDEHINGIGGVKEQLDQGKSVISDRYLFSSVAYQSIDTPIDAVCRYNSEYPYPQYIIYIDTPVEVCMERILSRSTTSDIFEIEHIQRSVYENYRRAFDKLPEGVRFIRVDGTLSIEEVTSSIRQNFS